MSAIRIFVGAAANSEDLESLAVLDFSIRKHASVPVDFNIMRLDNDEESPFFAGRWDTGDWATPFSGFRWAVPALCHFEGRAIYCDSDIVFLADIADLWRQDMGDKIALAKGGNESWRFCVTLWNCEAAAPFAKILEATHKRTGHRDLVRMFKSRKDVGRFAGNWNCIDGEDYVSLDDPDIKALHYSSEAHQPHLVHALPRLEAEGGRHWFDGKVKPHWRKDVQDLFDRTLAEALASGVKLDDYRPKAEFGRYRKASQRDYRSHKWAPAGA